MPSLIAYQKAITRETTIALRLPFDPATHQQQGTELATLADGRTVVCLPDGATLPTEQPAQIAASIQPLTLTPELRAEIRANSPHMRLIDQRVIEKIRAAYSIDDEMYFARIGVGAATGMYTPTPDELAAMQAFGVFVEGIRQWARAERESLGV